MPVAARIQFFKIAACGYYPRGSTEPAFGSLDTLSSDIGNWVLDCNLPIAETKTYESDNNGTLLPSYCFNHRESDEYRSCLLTIWIETETLSGGFGSVQGNSPVGSAEVDTQEVPAGGIPGFPAYFWIIPRHNLLVSIRLLDQRLNGHQQVNRYLQGFLETFSPHVVLADEPEHNGEYRVLGWAESDDTPITRYRPRFRSHLLRAPTNRELLRNRVSDISRVFIKKELRFRNNAETSFYQQLLQQLGLGTRTTSPVGTAFNGDFEFTPTHRELEQMIRAYDSGDFGLDDVGFRLTGNSTPIWLSSSSTKLEIDLNISLDQHGIADAESLLTELVARRQRILPTTNIING